MVKKTKKANRIKQTKTIQIEVDEGKLVIMAVPLCWIRPMVTCLCSKCAGGYYTDPEMRIRRADPSQTVFDHCDICGNSHGYDFVVFEKYEYKH